jgi:hypothetical protein
MDQKPMLQRRADHLAKNSFCRYLPVEIVKPMSHQILSNLVPLILQAGDEVLALVLEALRSVLGVDETALDGPLTGQLVDVMLQVWATNARGEFPA